MKIAVFFVGEVNDAGFNASALAGAEAAATEGLAEITVVSGVDYDHDVIRTRMAAILPEVEGLVFVGGQGNIVTPDMAVLWPSHRFAIVQGAKIGVNLASYDVRQEESAFLAGLLAARMTRSGTVAHLSGHRVTPGLKGRAAFVAGVRHGDPSISVLTGFCGTQDDSAITRAWAEAEIAAGADVIFTMLNGARAGAIEACRAARAWQIGNALDWVASEPDVFIASAVARIDLGMHRAIADMAAGVTPARIVEFGLASGDFVSLSLGASVPDSVADEIEACAKAIRNGRIAIPATYEGAEFRPGEQACADTP
jgi:basic membrane protein A